MLLAGITERAWLYQQESMAVAAGNEDMRDGFQDAMEASLIQAWPLVKYSGWLPSSLILEIAKV